MHSEFRKERPGEHRGNLFAEKCCVNCQGTSVNPEHQGNHQHNPPPAVWNRVIFLPEDCADNEHHEVAREVGESRCPVGIQRHKQHIHHHRDNKPAQSYVNSHRCLPRQFVPHRDIELHSEQDVGHQHYRHNSDPGAEVLAQNQGDDVNVKNHPEENQSAESGEIFHHFGVQLPGVPVGSPLKEKRLGCKAEHLDEKRHNYGQFHSCLVDSQT